MAESHPLKKGYGRVLLKLKREEIAFKPYQDLLIELETAACNRKIKSNPPKQKKKKPNKNKQKETQTTKSSKRKPFMIGD